MLKIGKVYLYKNDFYYYIEDKKRYGNKVRYVAKKVLVDGDLSKKKYTISFKNSDFKLTNFTVITKVIIPRENRNKIIFDRLVMECEKYVKRFNRWGKDDDAIALGRLAWSSVGLYDSESHEFPSISKLGAHLFDMTWQTYYTCIHKFLKHHFTPTKYQVALPDSADSTIIDCIAGYKLFATAYYGASKKIRSLVENDIAEYMKQKNKRNIPDFMIEDRVEIRRKNVRKI